MTRKIERSGTKKRLRQDFADNWSVIGYRYVYYGIGFRRNLWLVLLIAATILAGYLFYGTIIEYYNYETYIVNNVDSTRDELQFPTITFCNLNPQNVQKAIDNGAVKDLREYKEIYSYIKNENTSISYDRMTSWMEKNNITTFRQAVSELEMSYRDMAENKYANKMQDDTCLYENKRCTYKDMQDVMSWDHSLCYQYNPFNKLGVQRNSSIMGIDGGLHLFLDLGSEDSQVSNYPYNGVKVIINPYGITHLIGKYNDAIFVQPGTMNSIGLEKIETTLLEYPYATDCGEAEFNLITDYPYSKAMCEVDCLLQQIVSYCNCVGFEFAGYVGAVPVCNVSEMACYNYWKNQLKNHIPRNCSDNCPRECEYVSYKIRLSQATLGNNAVFDQLTATPGFGSDRSRAREYVTENMVAFKISFQNLYVKTQTVTAVATWTNLLGEIGGNLGLCMGLSILTVFELVFFIYDYFVVLLSCRSRKTDVLPEDELPYSKEPSNEELPKS